MRVEPWSGWKCFFFKFEQIIENISFLPKSEKKNDFKIRWLNFILDSVFVH